VIGAGTVVKRRLTRAVSSCAWLRRVGIVLFADRFDFRQRAITIGADARGLEVRLCVGDARAGLIGGGAVQ
jgi:hypothetical protein